jgi:hypothetical protein
VAIQKQLAPSLRSLDCFAEFTPASEPGLVMTASGQDLWLLVLARLDHVAHRADFHDLRFHHIAGLEVFGRRPAHANAGRRAGGDHIARTNPKRGAPPPSA